MLERVNESKLTNRILNYVRDLNAAILRVLRVISAEGKMY